MYIDRLRCASRAFISSLQKHVPSCARTLMEKCLKRQIIPAFLVT